MHQIYYISMSSKGAFSVKNHNNRKICTMQFSEKVNYAPSVSIKPKTFLIWIKRKEKQQNMDKEKQIYVLNSKWRII